MSCVVLFAAAAAANPSVEINGPATAVVGDDVFLESAIINYGEGDLSYQWFQLSGVPLKLSNQADRTLSFTVPPEAAGTRLVIQLKVSDRSSTSVPAVQTISVAGSTQPNGSPVAFPGSSVKMIAGTSVVLDGTGSRDPDGDVLTYSWVKLRGEGKLVLTNADTAKVTVTAPAVLQETIFAVQLTVADPQGATGSASVNVTVEPRGCGCSSSSLESGVLLAALLLVLRACSTRVSAKAPRFPRAAA